MDLHARVRGAITQVNPDRPVTLYESQGYSVGANGRQIPIYSIAGGSGELQPGDLVLGLGSDDDAVTGSFVGQIQALTGDDLKQIGALNLNGEMRRLYLKGATHGVARALTKGGDLVVFEDGSTWLVTQLLEQWPDWCAAAVTLQINGVGIGQ